MEGETPAAGVSQDRQEKKGPDRRGGPGLNERGKLQAVENYRLLNWKRLRAPG